MKCDEAKALLVDALTRAFTPAESLALESHVASCESCADAKRHLDADRETLALVGADSSTLQTRVNFDTAIIAKLAAAKDGATPRHARRRSFYTRWTIPAIAAAAAVAAFLIARPIDDASKPKTERVTSHPVAANDRDSLLENDVDDTVGFRDDDVDWIFSREDLAYLDLRADDAEGDEIANEISEMTDEAAHGLESVLDAARGSKSG